MARPFKGEERGKRSNILAENLSSYVKQSGKSQREIAHELGVSSSTFNSWCTGLSVPSNKKLVEISECLGIKTSETLERENVESELKGYAEKSLLLGMVDPNFRRLTLAYSELDQNNKELFLKMAESIIEILKETEYVDEESEGIEE